MRSSRQSPQSSQQPASAETRLQRQKRAQVNVPAKSRQPDAASDTSDGAQPWVSCTKAGGGRSRQTNAKGLDTGVGKAKEEHASASADRRGAFSESGGRCSQQCRSRSSFFSGEAATEVNRNLHGVLEHM